MSLIDTQLKKTVIRSARFSPALMHMIRIECEHRRIDFSNYIRYAARAAMKHDKRTVAPKHQPATCNNEKLDEEKGSSTHHVISKSDPNLAKPDSTATLAVGAITSGSYGEQRTFLFRQPAMDQKL